MFDESVLELIARHARSGVLVDSNLLLLFLVGCCDVELIERFKRTDAFDADDFEILSAFLGKFRRIITTPGLLSEVNSLAGTMKGEHRQTFLEIFKRQIWVLDERHIESKTACQHTYFAKCGLTDSAILTIAKDNLLVLTNDFQLAGLLAAKEIDCLNFANIRFPPP